MDAAPTPAPTDAPTVAFPAPAIAAATHDPRASAAVAAVLAVLAAAVAVGVCCYCSGCRRRCVRASRSRDNNSRIDDIHDSANIPSAWGLGRGRGRGLALAQTRSAGSVVSEASFGSSSGSGSGSRDSDSGDAADDEGATRPAERAGPPADNGVFSLPRALRPSLPLPLPRWGHALLRDTAADDTSSATSADAEKWTSAPHREHTI